MEETDADGTTALHWAVSYGQYDSAALLLENGANPNVIDNYQTSLYKC
ncbi:ankyrin repeat domain-containing protein [Shouchella clausii]|nr:ankyrin repeat domain-containing protein [Shouchella clausii]